MLKTIKNTEYLLLARTGNLISN